MKTISIIGSGSHTWSSINLLKQKYTSCKLLIFDDSFDLNNEEFIHDVKLVGKIKDIDYNSLIFLSVGDNLQRTLYFHKFKKQLIKENLFHKSAIVENNLTIGNSNQIFANVYINYYVTIEDNNIINTSAVLEHEVKLGSHNHISVGAKLCGRVKIGNNCMVGAGAVIIDKVSICDNVVIGAGAVVTKDITNSGIYAGVPVRKIK